MVRTSQPDLFKLHGRLPTYFPSISLSVFAPSTGSPKDTKP